MSMRPVTVAPSRMALGGSLTLTLTLNVRVTGSACGSTWRTRPFAVTAGSSVRATMIVGIRGSRPDHLRRHVEYGVPSLPAGHLEDHLSGLHDFPQLGAPGGDRSGDVGLELRVAHPVLGDFQLRLGVIHLGLRRAQPLLRLVEQNFRRKSAGQKSFLALERVARLRPVCPARRKERPAPTARRSIHSAGRVSPAPDQVRHDRRRRPIVR